MVADREGGLSRSVQIREVKINLVTTDCLWIIPSAIRRHDNFVAVCSLSTSPFSLFLATLELRHTDSLPLSFFTIHPSSSTFHPLPFSVSVSLSLTLSPPLSLTQYLRIEYYTAMRRHRTDITLPFSFNHVNGAEMPSFNDLIRKKSSRSSVFRDSPFFSIDLYSHFVSHTHTLFSSHNFNE